MNFIVLTFIQVWTQQVTWKDNRISWVSLTLHGYHPTSSTSHFIYSHFVYCHILSTPILSAPILSTPILSTVTFCLLPFCLLPFHLLPFCLLPFRLLPFRLLPFCLLKLILLTPMEVHTLRNGNICLTKKCTVNFLNIRTTKKFVVFTLKFEPCGSTIE